MEQQALRGLRPDNESAMGLTVHPVAVMDTAMRVGLQWVLGNGHWTNNGSGGSGALG